MEMVELVHKKQLKTVTRSTLALLRKYFRIEVVGVENLPKKGKALVVPNHSGFAGADAVLLTFVIKRETKRRARILAHRAFFDFSKKLKEVSEGFGLKRAGIQAGIDILNRKQLLIIFPEGETGNFKSTLKRYRMQKFHTGYLRMAIAAQAPIVPCLIIGAEESHLNLGNLDFSKWIKGIRVPLPLNLVPLPAKWKMIFLPAIPGDQYPLEMLEKPEALAREAKKLQRQMQKELLKLAKDREFVYSRQTRELADSMLRSYMKIRGKMKAPAR